MTRKFKNAVKGAVRDGVITPDEKAMLKKLAREENISDNDADIYIVQQLKKSKSKLAGENGWLRDNTKNIIGGVVTLGTVIIPLLIKGKGKEK